jgi:ribosomal protein RSM22 (predicted rRNA methylase)
MCPLLLAGQEHMSDERVITIQEQCNVSSVHDFVFSVCDGCPHPDRCPVYCDWGGGGGGGQVVVMCEIESITRLCHHCNELWYQTRADGFTYVSSHIHTGTHKVGSYVC